ncbi:MAG TPA: single-stranded-DNA-specific exonuclease RecJ [Terriglobales bacterium]|nr:single-stranded-DNA-specific exonuclease RecJ [Terriglobales bacterium]
MRWKLRQAEDAAVSHLISEAGLSPLIARMLVARGVRTADEARAYLSPQLSHLHSPYLMSGMGAAVERLEAALERKEKILIYGDYDVDGTVAIVLLKTAIELLGGTADYHVPHRIRDGYGMKDEVIAQAAGEGVRLIISVDTGIRAFAAAEAAQRAGVDLIVTDHHLPEGQALPRALVVLNPNQPGCEYPCKALCGAGVAFKVAQALLEKHGRESLLPSFLKMVAVATIADAVPLTGENRVFASLGLAGLRTPANPGLKALLEVAGLDRGPITAGDVGFRIAPRINAAGRMDVAQEVIEMFSGRDLERCREIAQRLNQLNADRQQEEARIVEAAFKRLDGDQALRESYCIVVEGEGWHRGVIGIVATRVVERYHRPALVVSIEGGEAHGSGRSLRTFHLLEALESCASLFTRFGGHAFAVGFALPAERVPELRAALDGFARARLTPADFEPMLTIDGEITLDQVTPDFLRETQRLAPFGMSNPQPVFAARGVRLAQPPFLLKEKHLKLRVMQGGRAFDALGWRMGERLGSFQAGDSLDLAFTVEQNPNPEFPGLQLTLSDVVRAEEK